MPLPRISSSVSVKLTKIVWVPWKEGDTRTQGKKSSLDVPQPARTRLLPDAFVSGGSHSSRQPGSGGCSAPAGRRAPGWAKGAGEPRDGLAHEEPQLSGGLRGRTSGLALGDLILHVAVNPTH